jgi:hypothetical protein
MLGLSLGLESAFKLFAPKINDLGKALFGMKDEHRLDEQEDVRIVIFARRNNKGKIKTAMQYCRTWEDADNPAIRNYAVMMQEDGTPMIFSAEQVGKLLTGL